MAIALAADPIIAAADLADVLPKISDTNRINFLINSVSASFREFTGRLAIGSGDWTQYSRLPPSPYSFVYLRATPVSEVSAVTLMYDGEDDTVLDAADYALENATTGKLVIPGYTVQGRGHGYQLKIEFTGGWSTVPGDIQAAAVEAIVYRHSRIDGQAGARSSSFDGVTTSFEQADLPQSVRNCWERYRIF